MLKNFLCVCLSVFLASLTISAASQTPHIIYEKPQNPAFFETYEIWQGGQMLENFRDQVLHKFSLESSLSLSIRNCDQPNAFYNAYSREIVMCWELLNPIVDAVVPRFSKSFAAKAAMSAFAFVLYHELGHALVNIQRTATFGREEDNADQIATLLLLEDNKRKNHADSNIGVLGVFNFWQGTDNAYLSKHQLTGPHSPDQQRAFNVVCWAIGSDPTSRYKHLAAMTKFPTQRIPSCIAEYQRAEEAMRMLSDTSTVRR